MATKKTIISAVSGIVGVPLIILIGIIGASLLTESSGYKKANDLCIMGVEKEKIEALKEGSDPEVKVSQTDEGKRIVFEREWMGCQARCEALASDKLYKSTMTHKCFGIGINLMEGEVQY